MLLSLVNGKTIIIKKEAELMEPIKTTTKVSRGLAAQTVQSQ